MLRRILIFCGLLIAIVSIVFPAEVLAWGIGVTPARIDFDVEPGGEDRATLNVINQSEEVSRFQVYIEGEYEKWLTISPDVFVLEPHQSEAVEVIVAPPFTASGEHVLSICVLALSPEPGFRVGTGVKVPAQVNVAGFPVKLMLFAGAAVLVILASGLFIWRKRKARGV